MSRIVVTGMGVISALGDSVNQNRLSLIENKCGMSRPLSLFPTRYANLLPFGEVRIPTDTLKVKLNADESDVTRTTLLALHAFNEALHDSGITGEEVRSSGTALIGASTVGGMCLTDELYHDSHEKENGSPFVSSYDCASIAIYLQSKYKMSGVVNTINTACSSSANAIMYGARLIRNGLAKRAIVGGYDSLSKFTINGFNSLFILSSDICTPFDENRKGLNLGEGAAFLVLEREEDATEKNIYASVSGYCNANDAFHPSSLSEAGDGPYLAMKGALESAGISSAEIDFINAHGTGTENNDEVESRAMIRLFNELPAFASTKYNTGHTLGAAGAIEAVFSILSLTGQEVYSGFPVVHPIPGTGLKPVSSYRKKDLQHVMSNSFGFGGNCTSLIFSKF